jgi:hypothetical protein
MCYKSFRALRLPLQFYGLSNDTSGLTFTVISHGRLSQIVNRKPVSLYDTFHFTYSYESIIITEYRRHTEVKDWSPVREQLHNLRASGNIVSTAGTTSG